MPSVLKVPRLVAALGAAFLVVTTLGVVSTSAASAPGPGAYDRSLSATECDLLGRVYTSGQGCSRTQCVKGARRYRKTFGAEACQVRGQGAYGYIATIEARRCTALGRRWLADVNYCASYPDRSATAVYDARQCVGPRTVYVLMTEADGFYDECVTPDRARELVAYARGSGADLATEAALRSAVQCDYRPATTYADGRCVADPGSVPAQGGVLLVGDSMTWRSADELARLRPAFEIDGEPARQLGALRAQLAYYRAGHGDPTGFILELGTVPPPKAFTKKDLGEIVRSLPAATEVMFVLPYTEVGTPVRASPNSLKIAGWMKAISRGRGNSCVADWPAYVRSRGGLLQDGIHVKKQYEKDWARWMSQQWSRC